MHSFQIFASLFFISYSISQPVKYDCPFSKPDLPCTCTDRGSPNAKIDHATCHIKNADVLPKFDTAKNQYVVNELDIIFEKNVKKIDAQSFVAFKSIDALSFVCEYENRTEIQFDPNSFDSVRINGIKFDYAKNTDSIFEAIKILKGDLQFLIAYQGNALKFKADQFNGFKNLKDISIFDSPIDSLDSKAFVGLEKSLKELTLVNTSLNQFPKDEIKILSQLLVLALDENPIPALDLSDFDGLNELLQFSGGEMRQLKTVSITALDKVPKSLKALHFPAAGLTTLDKSLTGLLDRNEFEFFDATLCRQFQCNEKLQWIAKYVSCGARKLKIDASFCDDGKLLSKYLNETVPQPECD